jgi:hypothetical protein
MLFFEYRYIAVTHPGWSLTEIKKMTTRERTYWSEFAKWEREGRKIHAANAAQRT